MLSGALFNVKAFFSDESFMTVSVEDCSVTGFTFRLAIDDARRFFAGLCRMECTVHTLHEHLCFPVMDPVLIQEEQHDYFCRVRVISEAPDFMERMRSLINEVRHYVHLKNYESDAVLSQHYTGYPPEGETDFAPDFVTARKEALSGLKADESWGMGIRKIPEIAITVCTPKATDDFLRETPESFLRLVMTEAGLSRHPIASLSPNVIYLGNPWCIHLFPEKPEMVELLEKCRSNRIWPVVVFPPMTEENTERFFGILKVLDKRLPGDTQPEVVVGDIGLPLMIRERFQNRFLLTAGPLLVRRRKDPRMYWWSGDTKLLKRTSANSPFFREWLAEAGISSVSWESCGYPIETEPGDVLHLPFYQIATATACTLNAVVHSGRRGYQPAGEVCARECVERCFLYGRSTGIYNRGNSLFGVDTRILTDSVYLSGMLTPGTRRVVIDLLH